MAYGKKYTASAAGLQGQVFKVDIYELDYTGTTSALILDQSGFIHKLLAFSDDPFEPFLSSEFTIRLDITNETGNIIDLESFDDRKYYIKFYSDYNLLWQGFVIYDNVSLPFNTGIIDISISCTDGIGMLKDVPYSPTTINYAKESIDTIIRNCLNQIGYPEGYFVNYACNIFASSMSETTPFTQTYIYPLNTQNKSYYEVLKDVLTSFGCQLYQSNGEWWVIAINERFNDTLRFVKVSNDGVADSPVTESAIVNIGIYPEQYHFVDATQRKIFRKGYSNITIEENWDHSANYFYNPDFLIAPSGTDISAGWSKNTTGSGTISLITENNIRKISMQITTTGKSQLLYYEGNIMGYIGNKLKISFNMEVMISVTSFRAMNMIIELQDITNGTNKRYLRTVNDINSWQTAANYEQSLFSVSQGTSVNIESDPLPFSGYVRVYFIVEDSGTGTYRTCPFVKINNLALSFTHPMTMINLTAALNSNSKYKKIINLPYTCNASTAATSATYKWIKANYFDFNIMTDVYVAVLEVTGLSIGLNGYYTAPGVVVPPDPPTVPSTIAYNSLTFYTNELVNPPGTSYYLVQWDYYPGLTSLVTGLPTVVPVTDFSVKTALLLSDGSVASNWGQYGGPKTLSHKAMLLQIFTRVLFGSQTNVEGTVMDYLLPKYSVSLTDITDKYNIENKRYIQGNIETNFIMNESSFTLIETDNEEKISSNSFIQDVKYSN